MIIVAVMSFLSLVAPLFDCFVRLDMRLPARTDIGLATAWSVSVPMNRGGRLPLPCFYVQLTDPGGFTTSWRRVMWSPALERLGRGVPVAVHKKDRGVPVGRGTGRPVLVLPDGSRLMQASLFGRGLWPASWLTPLATPAGGRSHVSYSGRGARGLRYAVTGLLLGCLTDCLVYIVASAVHGGALGSLGVILPLIAAGSLLGSALAVYAWALAGAPPDIPATE
ncbi:hypothetical protein I6A60_07550 [Frankia sp. AgB1.9]|uniref:hypothetical protein n=1 Tax=unclassified Frankia TaxID=2632575 RepID=UPI001933DC3F|nr:MULTISPECIES: hypothetical protein [unclassified Frankia]MBL7490718.1 hypothetical protein [Frankia sp. AgW1.1]MBL7547728.1 hypothetical protein [Frankia sp. AgB1.9]MBL7622631.1 hypothetical protein [Frankia sp. AgB1.8]